MICECCSERFYIFTKSFLKLNTDIFRKETAIKKYNFRDTSHKFSSILMEILNYINIITQDLDHSFNCDCHECVDEVMKRHKKIKIPLIKTTSDNLDEFIMTHQTIKKKGYLSLGDLEEFYRYTSEKQVIRKDINDKGLFITKHEVKWLSKKYNKSYDSLEDYIDNIDIGEEDPIVSNNYSWFKTILLNYLDYCYCPTCIVKKNYIECISESLYIKSSILTIMFDILATDKMLEILYTDTFAQLRDAIGTKLDEGKNVWLITCHRWKGVLVYYRKLGLLPPLLKAANIPINHYQTRVFSLFNESIVSHPLASHGLFYETLIDMQSIGAV